MKCTEFLDRLDAVVAGEVDAAEAAAARRHLETCATCRAEAEGLHRLFTAVAQLPPSVDPPRDLWPGITERIDAEATPVPFPANRRRKSFIYLAAAAVLAFAAVTAVLNFDHAPSNLADVGPELVGPESAVVEVDWNPAENDIYRVRRELIAVLKSRRHEISPATMDTVMANLAIIDDAMARIDSALVDEPGNTELQQLRLAVYQREAKLLKQVARMPADA